MPAIRTKAYRVHHGSLMSTAKSLYYVFRSGGILTGKWNVAKDDMELSSHHTQTEAIRWARDLAMHNHHPGSSAEVYVENDDGEFELEWASGEPTQHDT